MIFAWVLEVPVPTTGQTCTGWSQNRGTHLAHLHDVPSPTQTGYIPKKDRKPPKAIREVMIIGSRSENRFTWPGGVKQLGGISQWQEDSLQLSRSSPCHSSGLRTSRACLWVESLLLPQETRGETSTGPGKFWVTTSTLPSNGALSAPLRSS